VATKTGEILVYDAYSTSNMIKHDLMECKMIGKISTNLSLRMKHDKIQIKFHMRVIKGSIVLYTEDGNFEYISTLDIKSLLNDQNYLPFEYKSGHSTNISDPFIA